MKGSKTRQQRDKKRGWRQGLPLLSSREQSLHCLRLAESALAVSPHSPLQEHEGEGKPDDTSRKNHSLLLNIVFN